MAEYHLSQRATSDLDAIAKYTIERFGIEQARSYRDSLKKSFEQLAGNPELGRRAEQLASGLLRFEHRSHVIFYLNRPDGLLIVRILHSGMDVLRHFSAAGSAVTT